MNLFDQGLLESPLGWLVAGLVGLAFGFWLERAGFGSSRKLAAIFYFRDFAVVQVMFTAVATAAIGLVALDVAGLFDAASVYRMETMLGPQIIGGLLFGVGFVTGGWCPGTSLVGAASGKIDAIAFILATLAGSLVYAAYWPQLAPLQNVGACGVVTLPELLHLSPGVVAAIVVAAALVMFTAIQRFAPRRQQ
ncbi:MAG: YeeE/YedE family protein [Planctomycetes bacterium]|nr:YeeE/YedE family protein [Planctomycetota bacterium]